MGRAVELALGNVVVGHHRGWIEHPEPHTRREEADERRVDGALRKIALLHGVRNGA